jgi:ABC-type multidrug transport system fused ATPase/permease subunit
MQMNLIEAMRTEYCRSKKLLYWCALPIRGIVVVLALIGSLDVPTALSATLAVAALVAELVVFVLREVALQRQDIAEEVRRLAMLQDGLNIHPEPSVLARLRDRIGDCNHSEPPIIGSYYDSSEQPGPRRLLEITAESAFFSGGNSRRMAIALGSLSAGFLLLTFFSLITAALFLDQAAVRLVAKTTLVLIAFFATAELASLSLSFHSLARSCEAIGREVDFALAGRRTQQQLQHAAFSLFAEYNVAVAKAPPIPALVYKMFQNRMNEAWKLRSRTPEGSSSRDLTGEPPAGDS